MGAQIEVLSNTRFLELTHNDGFRLLKLWSDFKICLQRSHKPSVIICCTFDLLFVRKFKWHSQYFAHVLYFCMQDCE